MNQILHVHFDWLKGQKVRQQTDIQVEDIYDVTFTSTLQADLHS